MRCTIAHTASMAGSALSANVAIAACVAAMIATDRGVPADVDAVPGCIQLVLPEGCPCLGGSRPAARKGLGAV